MPQDEIKPNEALRSDGSAERALMRAVLADAIACLAGVGAAGRRPRLMREARAWVTSRDTSWPFAFESICEVLGLDPASVRRRLLSEIAAGAQDATHATDPGAPEIVITRRACVGRRGARHDGLTRLRYPSTLGPRAIRAMD